MLCTQGDSRLEASPLPQIFTPISSIVDLHELHCSSAVITL